MLAEVRQREEELARERGFLANEAGDSSASALQALQEQVARQKATIATLQKQMSGFGDTVISVLLHLIQQPIELLLVPFHVRNHLTNNADGPGGTEQRGDRSRQWRMARWTCGRR